MKYIWGLMFWDIRMQQKRDGCYALRPWISPCCPMLTSFPGSGEGPGNEATMNSCYLAYQPIALGTKVFADLVSKSLSYRLYPHLLPFLISLPHLPPFFSSTLLPRFTLLPSSPPFFNPFPPDLPPIRSWLTGRTVRDLTVPQEVSCLSNCQQCSRN